MPIVSIPGLLWPPRAPFSNSSAPTLSGNGAINASGDRVAWIIRAPKAGVLHSFEFNISTVGNNPDNGLRLSFQDVSATTGLPDTVADQYRDFTGTAGTINTGWVTPVGPLTTDGTDNGTKRTVAAGELVACVVDFTSFVASDSVTISRGWSLGLADTSLYGADGSSGAYSKYTNVMPALALKYADGTYAQCPFIIPSATVNTHTFGSGSDPDERGFKFTAPATMQVIGAYVLNTPNNFDFKLYDSLDQVIASGVVDTDQLGAGTIGWQFVYFTAAVNVTAGLVYRLTLLPTVAGTSVIYSFTLPSAAHMGAMPGGTTMIGTSRVNAGVFADSDVTIPVMGLILGGVDVSSGGGGNSGGIYFASE